MQQASGEQKQPRIDGKIIDSKWIIDSCYIKLCKHSGNHSFDLNKLHEAEIQIQPPWQ